MKKDTMDLLKAAAKAGFKASVKGNTLLLNREPIARDELVDLVNGFNACLAQVMLTDRYLNGYIH